MHVPGGAAWICFSRAHRHGLRRRAASDLVHGQDLELVHGERRQSDDVVELGDEARDLVVVPLGVVRLVLNDVIRDVSRADVIVPRDPHRCRHDVTDHHLVGGTRQGLHLDGDLLRDESERRLRLARVVGRLLDVLEHQDVLGDQVVRHVLRGALAGVLLPLHVRHRRAHGHARDAEGFAGHDLVDGIGGHAEARGHAAHPDVEADEVAEGGSHGVPGDALVLASVLLRAGADLQAPGAEDAVALVGEVDRPVVLVPGDDRVGVASGVAHQQRRVVDLHRLRLGLRAEVGEPRGLGVRIVGDDVQLGLGGDGVPGGVLGHALVRGLVAQELDGLDPQDGSAGHVEDHVASVAADLPAVLAPLDPRLRVARGAARERGHAVVHHDLVDGPLLELRRVTGWVCVDERTSKGQQEQEQGRQQQGRGRGGASRRGTWPHPAPCFE